MAEEPWAQLGDAIIAIRAELQRAEAEGREQSLKFETGPVELEFAVDVKVEGEARTKVLVLPWSAEAKLSGARDRVHRVKLTLQPLGEDGRSKRKIAEQSAERPR